MIHGKLSESTSLASLTNHLQIKSINNLQLPLHFPPPFNQFGYVTYFRFMESPTFFSYSGLRLLSHLSYNCY